MGIRTVHWTDEQAAAVTASGDVLLAASAGTGKTTTVVGKILWMLGLEAGLHGDCLLYTSDAADECPAV